MDFRSTACGFIPDCGNAALPRHSVVDLVAGRHLCRRGHRRDTLVRFDDGVVGVDRKIAVESIVLQESYGNNCNRRDEQSDAPQSPVGRELKSTFFGGDMGDRSRYVYEPSFLGDKQCRPMMLY